MKTNWLVSLALFICLGQASGLRMGLRPTPAEEDENNWDDSIEEELINENLKRIQNFEPSSWAHFRLDRQCISEVKAFFSGDSNESTLCVDPWFDSRDCSQEFSIPGYRIGDCIFSRGKTRSLKLMIRQSFPDSIAGKYLERTDRIRDMDTLYEIIASKDYEDYEKPSEFAIVVHVRAGDVIERCNADFWNGELCEYGLDRNNYLIYLRNRTSWERIARSLQKEALFTSVVLVTGDHMGLGQDEKKNELNRHYTDNIANVFQQMNFEVTKRLNHNADCDFIYMSHAHNLVRTGGWYDHMLGQMVQKMGHRNILV